MYGRVLKFFICMCLMFLFIQCENHSESVGRLLRVEALMVNYPDSALWLLEEFESPEKLPKEQYAHWCLLITQAQHKNYIKLEDASLIQVAVEYYESTDDVPRKMLAYYYNAIVLQELGDALQAQEWFLKVLDIGKNSKDYTLLGRTYANLGTLYLYQHIYDSAQEYEIKALDCFQIIEDSLSQGLVLRNLGRIYTMKNSLDSAAYYYEEALLFARESSRSSIYNELGNLYASMRNYSKAFEYVFDAIACLGKSNDSTSVYLTLGDLYYQTGQQDSALLYLSESLKSSKISTKIGAYSTLAYIEEGRNNWPVYAKYQKEIVELRDSLLSISELESLHRMQSLFNYQQIEEERNRFEQESQRKTIYTYHLLTLIGLLITLFVIIYLVYRNQKQEEQERIQQQLRLSEQKHRQTESFLQEKEDAINKLEKLLSTGKLDLDQAQKQLVIAQRQMLEAEMGKNKVLEIKQKSWAESFYDSDFYSRFASINGRVRDHEWNELAAWIDVMYPDFTYRLKELYPAITDKEFRICYLIKIKVSVSRIAKLLCMRSQGISNARKRLYTKITGYKGSAMDLDDFIEEF